MSRCGKGMLQRLVPNVQTWSQFSRDFSFWRWVLYYSHHWGSHVATAHPCIPGSLPAWRSTRLCFRSRLWPARQCRTVGKTKSLLRLVLFMGGKELTFSRARYPGSKRMQQSPGRQVSADWHGAAHHVTHPPVLCRPSGHGWRVGQAMCWTQPVDTASWTTCWPDLVSCSWCYWCSWGREV